MLRLALLFVLIPGFLTTGIFLSGSEYVMSVDSAVVNVLVKNDIVTNKDLLTDKLSARIISLMQKNDIAGLGSLADSLIVILGKGMGDLLLMSEHSYYAGVCKLLSGQFSDALRWLNMSVELKDRIGHTDIHYAKAIFNIGIIHNHQGDYYQVINEMLRYIELSAKFYGENSTEAAEAYSMLIGASVEIKDIEKVRNYIFKALDILSINRNALQESGLSSLYQYIGIGYITLGDYAKARIYLEEAEAILKKSPYASPDSYINLLNSLAVTYGFLGLSERESEYFNRGIDLAMKNNSYLAFNMINTYVIGLGNAGNHERGDALLSELVETAKKVFGKDSRYYIEVLRSYAEYLLGFKIDYPRSLTLFRICVEYLEDHNVDISLKERILTGYAESLFRNGEPYESLIIINNLLFFSEDDSTGKKILLNPQSDSIRSDRRTISLLRLKHEVLWSLFRETDSPDILEAAAGTSELIITLIDKMRIRISEEESRLVLGVRYRESYLLAIRDFEMCYRRTGNIYFLEKAFEFSEKSKVAGLLAATRELNAIQFHVPAPIADLEKSLNRSIGLYNSQISVTRNKEDPDLTLLNDYNERLLEAVNKRDSLIHELENNFPGYYSIKYKTSVPSMEDVISVVGKNINYISYSFSDSVLYTFLVNRKYRKIFTFKIDSSFFNNIRSFRSLLSEPSVSQGARTSYNEYQKTSHALYKILIDPLRDYFISDRLIISPDNLLSYLPFETMVTEIYESNNIVYRKLNYLLNNYSISYTYSAAFLNETTGRGAGSSKELIAFAPSYLKTHDTDSLFPKRQNLHDLPYARNEAEYVADLTGGKLFMHDKARESVYKAEAGNYDIIHLAMHTLLNDQNPMNSSMIFTSEDDPPEDGMLYTYEVYGVPLKARMVVLSSCNTGSGLLSSGEGILSLARGFLYSGSRSVVMSMWEIEDRSGTEIIKMFYQNLRKGKSKSKALKKARHDYLKSAGQLKSHPYFWAALVIYGEDAPVYSKRRIIVIAGILLVAAAIYSCFLLRRRYP